MTFSIQEARALTSRWNHLKNSLTISVTQHVWKPRVDDQRELTEIYESLQNVFKDAVGNMRYLEETTQGSQHLAKRLIPISVTETLMWGGGLIGISCAVAAGENHQMPWLKEASITLLAIAHLFSKTNDYMTYAKDKKITEKALLIKELQNITKQELFLKIIKETILEELQTNNESVDLDQLWRYRRGVFLAFKEEQRMPFYTSQNPINEETHLINV